MKFHEISSLVQHQSYHINPQDLRAGTTIICDRYAFSGVAYSAAKGEIEGFER